MRAGICANSSAVARRSPADSIRPRHCPSSNGASEPTTLSSSSPDVSYGGEWFATGRNRWTGKDVQLRVVTVCRPA